MVPVLVATAASPASGNGVSVSDDGLASCILTNEVTISQVLQECVDRFPNQPHLDAEEWSRSRYKPTPTIVQAAQALYRGHDVREISRNDAGKINLAETASALTTIIEDSKVKNRKSICFVTGVPGAGKTLAGLNITTNRMRSAEDEHAVFLSGNGPLVDVLREALARDESEREGLTKKLAKQHASAFIQNVHHFRDDNLISEDAPVEKVVVFDEAQRAWNADQAAKFMSGKRGIQDFNQSEPEFLVRVMDRHEDWCVIIALIGGGQEINTGEAGLPEWFMALRNEFSDWDVFYSDKMDSDEYIQGGDLGTQLDGLEAQSVNGLHLGVCLRSFRAERVSEFVHHVVSNEPDAARQALQAIDKYPIYLTRDIEEAKAWLRFKARGSELFGLLASSGAMRLKPYAINVKSKISPPQWFLNGSTDVRSCQYLEEVGTEFDVQGLELDWCCVAWDADLRYLDGEWRHHAFVGTKWTTRNATDRRRYLTNAYRVLLTRARQGMVIFVPEGNEDDPTRPPEFYDGTHAFLQRCGIPFLPSNQR